MEIATTLKEAPYRLKEVNMPPETSVYIIVDDQEPSKEDWKQALIDARGLWKNRTDLPDFQSLRREFDRDL